MASLWNQHSSHEAADFVTLHGPQVTDDFDHLFGPSALRRLWFLFLAITTRSNPMTPAVMRKRELVRLMRQARVIVGRGTTGAKGRAPGPAQPPHHPLLAPLLEADVNVLHQAEQSRGPGRQFTWTPFLRSLVAAARRAYRRAPGGEPHALRLLLEVGPPSPQIPATPLGPQWQ